MLSYSVLLYRWIGKNGTGPGGDFAPMHPETACKEEKNEPGRYGRGHWMPVSNNDNYREEAW